MLNQRLPSLRRSYRTEWNPQLLIQCSFSPAPTRKSEARISVPTVPAATYFLIVLLRTLSGPLFYRGGSAPTFLSTSEVHVPCWISGRHVRTRRTPQARKSHAAFRDQSHDITEAALPHVVEFQVFLLLLISQPLPRPPRLSPPSPSRPKNSGLQHTPCFSITPILVPSMQISVRRVAPRI